GGRVTGDGGLRCGSGSFRCSLGCGSSRSLRCLRQRAALDLGVAQGLDLGEALLFFVHTDGDELDHLFGDAQAALDLGDQRALGGDVQQDVKAVVELANGVGETAASHLLDALDLTATVGDVGRKAFDELVDLCFFN